MQPIYIPHLEKALDKTRVIEVDQHLADLETLTPVKGRIRIQHRGNFLEVSTTAETIVTLVCHRCLQNYNYRLQVDTSEFIWLQEPESETFGVEREVDLEDLVETLPPQGHFHPDAWLYEQLCLALPQRQLCDQACPGIEAADSPAAVATDHRWTALAALKQQLSDH